MFGYLYLVYLCCPRFVHRKIKNLVCGNISVLFNIRLFYTFTEKPHFLLKPKGNVGRQILCKCVLVASVREYIEAVDLFLARRSVSP